MQPPVTGFDRAREMWSRRGRLGIMVASLAFAAVLGLALGLPNLYRASATVLVEKAEAEAESPGAVEARVQAIGQKILSRTQLTGLIERFDLYHDLRPTASTEAVLERMRHDVKVDLKEAREPGGRGLTTSFTVAYRGKQPAVVAAVTNTLASAYVEEDSRIRGGEAAELLAQINEMKRQLEDKERRLGGFRIEHASGLPRHPESDRVASLEGLRAQLRTASEGRVRAMERRSELYKTLAEADPSGVGDPDAAEARLNRLNKELSELRRRFTDKYPDVQKLKAEIAALEKQARDSREKPRSPGATPAQRSIVQLKEALSAADEEVRILGNDEASLRREVESQQRSGGAAPQSQQPLLELARDYEAAKALYGSLVKQYQQTGLAAGAKPESARRFRILEAAVPPSDPVAPNRFRLLFAGLILALGLGLVAMAVAERTDVSFHSVDDVRAFTPVPVLVSIPAIQSKGDMARRRHRRWLAAASVLLGVFLVARASYHMAKGSDDMVLMLTRLDRS